MQFDLLENPFVVLGLTGDASVSVISSRARDLGTTEAAAASRVLLVPRTRLQAELWFLPGAETLAAVSCLDDLRAGREPNLSLLTPLARANVLAHLAFKGMATARQLQDLVGLQETIRYLAAKVIDQASTLAGMPPLQPEMLDAVLEGLAGQHADGFAAGMLALPNGAELFAEELCTTAPEATVRVSFLRRSAATWDRATASEVAQILDLAAPIEAILRDHPDLEAATQLAELVQLFVSRTKPAREAFRLVGLSHEESIRAARRWRAVALDLNNRQDAVSEAVAVLAVLADGFGTTDELGALTAKDLDVCRERLASGEGTPEIKRLELAIAAAVENELAFQRSGMSNGRPTETTPYVVSELYNAFVAATAAAQSDLPWQLLRTFLIRLHNEFSATEAAFAFTELAIEKGTSAKVAANVVAQLRLDRRFLRTALLNIELAMAFGAKHNRVAQRLLIDLIELTDNIAERNKLQAILDKLNNRETAAIIKYCVYGALAFLIILIAANGGNRATQSAPSYTPAYTQPPTARSAAPSPPAVEDLDAGPPERQPAPGTAVLKRSELRWCRYADARAKAATDYLDAIRSNPIINTDRFNASVDAYNAFIASMNSACGAAKAWPADGLVIDAELTRNAAVLSAEGHDVITRAYQGANAAVVKVAPSQPYNSAPPLTLPLSNSALPYSLLPPHTSAATNALAYSEGQVDRQSWEAWVSGVTGAFHDGAEWWAGVRSTPHPPSCEQAAGIDHAAAVSGCRAAQSRLDNADRRRHTEPDYRKGWNSP